MDQVGRTLTRAETNKRSRRRSLIEISAQANLEPRKATLRSATLGSTCSGCCVESLACEQLGVNHTQVFACDNNPAVKQSCKNNIRIGMWVNDAHSKSHKRLPHTDVFVSGFPCQPFPLDGSNYGESDPRASVVRPIIMHI